MILSRKWAVVALAGLCGSAFSQVAFTGSYSENFDSWPREDSDGVVGGTYLPWTNNSTFKGWYESLELGGSVFYQDKIGVGQVGQTQRLTALGMPIDGDRAIGSGDFAATSANNFFIDWGFQLRNDTGETIEALRLQFTVEHWRRAIRGSGSNQTTEVNTTFGQYRIGGTDISGNDFISAPTLDMVSQDPFQNANTAASIQNGNLAENQTLIDATISGFSLAAGESIWLRWRDKDNLGRDATLAMDNLTVTVASAPVPEPATLCALLPALALLRRKRAR